MKNRDTPEGRAFWDDAKAAAEEVATWPAWKRGESTMTAYQDLARQLVAHPRWEWRPRMLARRWVPGFRDHLRMAYTVTDQDLGQNAMDGHVPDLSDHATQGVLLGMLREAATSKDDTDCISIGVEGPLGVGTHAWAVNVEGWVSHANTHGEALAHALLAAWGV